MTSRKGGSVLPDYRGGSIVNLMSSIARASRGKTPYRGLKLLPAKELEGTRHIILLVIDGLGYEWVLKHGKGSFLKQHLVGSMTSVFPPTTATAMTTFYTGVAPQQHAFTGWFMHFKEIGMTIAPLPFTTRSGAISLRKSGIAYADLLKERPLSERLGRKLVCVLPRAVANSPYNDVVMKGAERRTYTTMEGCFRQLATSGKRNRKLAIIGYWPIIDKLSHHYGPDHKEVEHHFRRLDARIARFAESLPSGTTLIVTADHGLMEGRRQHQLKDYPQIMDCLSAPLTGEPRLAYCYVHPEQEQTFVRLVKKLGWCTARKSGELVKEGYFGKGKQSPSLKQRIGDYVLILKEGNTLGDNLLTEPDKKHRGHHGGVSAEEMLVPLIVLKK